LVARLGRTSQDQLAEARSAITRVHADVLGVVLNQVQGTTTRSRRKNYAADTDRRHARRPAAPAAPRIDNDAHSGADRGPDAHTEPEHDALSITEALPPPSPRAGRPEAWSGSAPPGPGTSPPAAT
jgi:hypothetical protein